MVAKKAEYRLVKLSNPIYIQGLNNDKNGSNLTHTEHRWRYHPIDTSIELQIFLELFFFVCKFRYRLNVRRLRKFERKRLLINKFIKINTLPILFVVIASRLSHLVAWLPNSDLYVANWIIFGKRFLSDQRSHF